MANKSGKNTGKGKSSGSGSKELSAEDKHIWQHVTSRVMPLSSNRYVPFKDGARVDGANPLPPHAAATGNAASSKKRRVRLMSSSAEGAGARLPFSDLSQELKDISARSNVAGLDRKSSEKLRRGKMEIEGRVDLHGFTRKQAHTRLRSFIHSAHRKGSRCVLVITGKGSSAGKAEDDVYMGGGRKGILREEVPRWLMEPDLRKLVLDFRTAQPRHGGEGALYVLLRRSRTEMRD